MRQMLARPAATAAGCWTAIYLLLCATGQRFSTQYLDIAWQLIPTETLRSDPIGSVWRLHIQPPLWNLIVGATLAWSPAPDAISLQIIEFAFGLTAVALLASLLSRLFGRTWPAVLIAVVVMCDPQVMSSAFTPTYELPTTCGLIAVLWLAARATESPRLALLGVSVVGTAVVLTRTVFHPIWLVIIVAVIGWVVRSVIGRRAVIVAVSIPVVLIGGWFLKNAAMFDRPTLSSWFGMNLQRAVVPVATNAQLNRWAVEGHISEITAAFPNGFVSYSAYEPYVGECIVDDPHPATADTTRGGAADLPNFNAECYLPLYDIAGHDARWVILHHPGLYAKGRWWAARAWIMEAPPPIIDTSPIYDASWRVYRALQVGVPYHLPSIRWADLEFGAFTVRQHLSAIAALATALVIGAGVRAAWRRLRRRPSPQWVIVEVAGAVIVAWNFVVGVLFELGEQYRFRATTDPITYALAAWLLWRLVVHLRQRGAGLPESTP